MGKHAFWIVENMENTDTEWRLLGDHQKRLHFKFVLFLTFAQMLENILENEIRETISWKPEK